MTVDLRIPHLRIVVWFCIVAIIGYAVVSLWAVFASRDPSLRGDVIGTWKSFAVAAFAFWLGSSSGGKAKDQPDLHGDPMPVRVANTPGDPVPTVDESAAR